MKSDPVDPLLSEVLLETENFRASTRVQLRQLAARRRTVRAVRRAAGTVAVLAVLAGIVFFPRPDAVHGPSPALAPTLAPAVTVIHTTPLPPGQVVSTRPDLFAEVSSSPQSLALVSTEPASILTIETKRVGLELEYLDDQHLLAAFPDQHPALIEAGTDAARLIFY